MATTITSPSAYSSIKSSVVFTINRDDDSIMEVLVNGYIKLLPPGGGSVNVSHYYREYFDVRPVVDPNSTFRLFAGAARNRVVEAHITVDGLVSEHVPLICAEIQPQNNRFMSDLRRRIISRGQVDEMSFFLSEPATLAYGDIRTSIPERGLWVVAFTIPEQCPGRFTVSLEATDGVELDQISYEIEQSNGVRLGWVNHYGAVDFWNFPVCRKTAMKIARETIYSSKGYQTTSMQADTTRTLTSQVLPEADVMALSQLLTADAAWVIEGVEATPIDITSDSATLSESEKPSAVVVEYRNKNR